MPAAKSWSARPLWGTDPPFPTGSLGSAVAAIVAAVLLTTFGGCADEARTLTVADCDAFPAATWTQRDDSPGTFATDGEVKGYLATRESFGDAIVSVEYRFLPIDGELPGEDANTGLLLLIDDTDSVWPVCVEAQGKWAEMAELKSNGGLDTVEATVSSRQRDAARRPVGSWNQLRTTIADGRIRVRLNGVPVAESDTAGRTSGRIGVQSERFPVEFRNWTVQPLGDD